jgi:CheY-like chemotaxis protein
MPWDRKSDRQFVLAARLPTGYALEVESSRFISQSGRGVMSWSSVLRRLVGSSATPSRVGPPTMALRILIVDDEAAVRNTISRLLATRGHVTTTAESATAALVRLRTERFDVMLCDVRMPEFSGIDLLPEVLAADEDLAVLMLTGVNDLDTAKDALAAGAVDYLIKPIELADLDEAVQRAAQHRDLRIVRRAGQRPDL